jgi:hypothetical protein
MFSVVYLHGDRHCYSRVIETACPELLILFTSLLRIVQRRVCYEATPSTNIIFTAPFPPRLLLQCFSARVGYLLPPVGCT